jgi:hypothetical protein
LNLAVVDAAKTETVESTIGTIKDLKLGLSSRAREKEV